MNQPLAIDLYCGLGGWAEGLIAEGWSVIGFDLYDMRKQFGVPPLTDDFQLVLQDVLTLHGSQFRSADLIVASPPCQAYSYRAMPWKRAKALPPPDNSLFDACFRIQREACAAAGRHIPMVVENVKGAQPWVGRAVWHYGSYYLWGNMPALMPSARILKVPGMNFHDHEKTGQPGRSFRSAAVDGMKNNGGSWFNIGSPGQKETNQNPVHGGVKQPGHSGRKRFADPDVAGHLSSSSPARKAASAMIAKIPFELARHIGQVYKPEEPALLGEETE